MQELIHGRKFKSEKYCTKRIITMFTSLRNGKPALKSRSKMFAHSPRKIIPLSKIGNFVRCSTKIVLYMGDFSNNYLITRN